MSGVEPAVLAAIIAGGASVASTGISLIAASNNGTDPVTPADPKASEITASAEELARRRKLIQRRRGTESLSFDPATSTTGLSI